MYIGFIEFALSGKSHGDDLVGQRWGMKNELREAGRWVFLPALGCQLSNNSIMCPFPDQTAAASYYILIRYSPYRWFLKSKLHYNVFIFLFAEV